MTRDTKKYQTGESDFLKEETEPKWRSTNLVKLEEHFFKSKKKASEREVSIVKVLGPPCIEKTGTHAHFVVVEECVFVCVCVCVSVGGCADGCACVYVKQIRP